MAAINPDDILSALYTVLTTDDFFNALVRSIDKGPKRRNRFTNPSCTVSLLTAPIQTGTNMIRGSALVKVYADDVQTGQADSAKLGSITARAIDVLHDSRPYHTHLQFHWVWAAEPVGPLPSDIDGEHLMSVRFNYAVSSAI